MTAIVRRDAPAPGSQPEPGAAFLEVIETARRFVAAHDEAAASSAAAAPSPLTFAEGVERDALAFRLERAARELRRAVRAMDAAPSRTAPAPAGQAMRSVRERDARGHDESA
ncbi:hypothetical protein GCM10010964_02520 [Caldovatus sediminis]|uniref:Uncharacterized protein n=1 Tax=Caldovatus sediminis TaxID=2041189 RepID=A0A8J2Z7Y7_9PROT|nr:hypothetical protein [Caldovatus sediminis]GGG17814.1 hypothetical protein GCM10010964_02520 [Caldovatus sediminis]